MLNKKSLTQITTTDTKISQKKEGLKKDPITMIGLNSVLLIKPSSILCLK